MILLPIIPSPIIKYEAPTIPVAEAKTYELGDEIPEEVIDNLIARHATGLKAYQMKRTLWCESRFYNIQSNIVRRGVREESYGIAQIHLPSHPSISKEQALDPEFAISFMSEYWNSVAWYGYSRSSDVCKGGY